MQLPEYIVKRIDSIVSEHTKSEDLRGRTVYDVVGRVGDRDVKVVGASTVLSLPEPAPGDPFSYEWARHLSHYLPETMCGPAVSGVSFTADRRTLCMFEAPSTDRCVYGCAPLFALKDSVSYVRVFPPCHGRDSPTCCRYAGNCPSEVCVTMIARACLTKDQPCPCYYTTGYAFLDLTADWYSFVQFELQADGMGLVYVDLGQEYSKDRFDILFGYMLLHFEYHF